MSPRNDKARWSRRTLIAGLLGLSAVVAAAQPAEGEPQPSGVAARILVDGEVADWQGIPPAHRDPPGDADPGRPDLGRLWIANDEHYLFLRLEVGTEILAQAGNELTLYLDSDADAETGVAVHGVGAELVWRFGERRGEMTVGRPAGPRPTTSVPVTHQQIGLISAPTHSAREFEIVLSRSALPRPLIPLFDGERIRLALADGGGDVLPDAGGVTYRFADAPPPALPEIALDKRRPDHLRILSYNVNNHLGEPQREAAHRRILRALGPDLVALQEVRDLSARRTAAYAGGMLGPPATGEWHAAKAGGESNVLLSAYPIAAVHPLSGSAAFLVDSRPAYGREILLIVLSLPCCDRERERREEVDLVMAFVRDAVTAGGGITLERGTPIVLIGDANLVGSADQRRTLLSGEIVDRERFGPAFAPDWDGTAFTDLAPRHTHRPLTFTWYGQGFSPGRLDYVIYSDAVLESGNRFVLFTPDMPAGLLARHGLERQDVLAAGDHLPLVADFALEKPPAP